MDKQWVATQFGRRVDAYEAVTPVQGRMAERLADGLPMPTGRSAVRRIVELGCGTGRLTRMLVQRYPGARVIAIDLSRAMIEYAREHCPQAEFVCADAERYVSQISGNVDIIVSNAAIQWFNDPAGALDQYRARLSSGGVLVATTLGDQTFRELRQALTDAGLPASSDPADAVLLPLPAGDDWRRRLPDARVTEELWIQRYPDVRTFLRALQRAGVAQSGHVRRPVSAAVLRRLIRHPNPWQAAEGVPVTYHIVRIALNHRCSAI